ncbi:GMC family oxidoreductase N-terminal domain-containing protein [Paracoccus albus]|uniref:GMC family oxidoreductase N-terminal domain-containing protein n=1 Tax=Paracoccus albus TaxID=3017784 RepID=UPI0022F02004|nr:GMC family oxidoreductase N-terminal domain-containing protein [Paracoccus albus]WBU59936.1 GMC family oxidoreductase N-terminal domain-containing protein [Paracoccus albus]
MNGTLLDNIRPDRRFFILSIASAVLAASTAPALATGSPPPAQQAALRATHDALFGLWFPLDELGLSDTVKDAVTPISAQVSDGIFAAFQEPPLSALLAGMTNPDALPFHDKLVASDNDAVKAFISSPGGFGALGPDQQSALLSFFMSGSAGPVATQIAQVLREAYLSMIWGLPLAEPLADFVAPPVFVKQPDIYAGLNAPKIAPSRLRYDPATQTVSHADGPIEYLVIGSGPGGATVASQLRQAGKRVVLVEKGPFVVWGSMDTRSYAGLMYRHDRAATVDNAIVIRSGETLGGGSAVNIDLAFSPLEATVQARINEWIESGLMDGDYYATDSIAAAYQWVREAIGTRTLSESELNNDNRVLWDGAASYGVDPSLYHLNRFPVGDSPSPVNDKRDAARQLIYEALGDDTNPLGLIPDATVDRIIFDDTAKRATGISFRANAPWTDHGNTIVDPAGLNLPLDQPCTINAENVVLAAGTLGSTRVLLNTAEANPAVANDLIGRGLILHPSFPLMGRFDKTINLLQGLDSATYVSSFGVSPGFIYETMGGLPAYGAPLIPGSGKQVFDEISSFNNYAGFGCMLVDTPSHDNRIVLDAEGNTTVEYSLSADDKARFRTGVGIGIRMMFLAGASQVIIPSSENVLGLPDFDPMVGTYLTDIAQADLVEQNIAFTPNRTTLTSAHLQASNKMGPHGQGVVSLRHRLWAADGSEIPNVYVMDSSIFPTSVGANPMQSIYSIAKIFSDRLIAGIPT